MRLRRYTRLAGDRVACGDYMPHQSRFALGGVNDDGVVSDDCGATYFLCFLFFGDVNVLLLPVWF